MACLAPVVQESVGIKLPGEAEEKPQETDADVVKRDVILVCTCCVVNLHVTDTSVIN